MSYLLLLAGILLALTYGIRRALCFSHTPPGPPSSSRVRRSIRRHAYETFAGWSREFGSVIYFKVLWKHFVVVNGLLAGDELFNKRSAMSSDRPCRVAAHLCHYDLALALMSVKHDRFKRTRRQLHELLNARTISSQLGQFEHLALGILCELSDSTDDVHSCVRLFFTRSILSWTLGYDADSPKDPLLVLSEKVNSNGLMFLSPSPKFWIDLFPILKHFPIAVFGKGVHPSLKQLKEELYTLLHRSDDYVRKHLGDHGSASFLATLYRKSKSEEERETALFASVSLTGGAYDTMISLTTSFLMAMLICPEAQRRAQEEIDALTGRTRLLTHSDRPLLPYTEALFTELMRWMPPIPLTSRAIAQDMIFEGYHLPKGCTLIANIWAMMRDPLYFCEPDKFMPDRFLAGGAAEAHSKDVRHLVFGFGRRICPGQYYADAALWTTVCSILAVFDISVPDGAVIPADPEVEDGAIIKFAPFPCKLTLRFAGAKDLFSAGRI